MWVIFAFASALFAGLTAILAKCGIRKTDSDAATAIRTIVVLLFSWLMVWIVGSGPTVTSLSAKTWIFLILSGLATGGSWLCYYKALQDGLASVVVPIDKLMPSGVPSAFRPWCSRSTSPKRQLWALG